MTSSVFKLKRLAFAVLLATLWAGPAQESHSATRTLRTDIGYPWINDGAPSNWVEGVFPVATDDIVLNGSGQWGGFFSPTYNSIKFYDMAACYTGGTINVTTNFTMHSGTTCQWGDLVHGLNVTGNISIGATSGAHLHGFSTTNVGGSVTIGTAAPSTWTLVNGNATIGGALNLGTSAASYGNLNLNNRALTVPTLNGNGGTIFFQTASLMTLTGGASTLGAATAVNGAGTLALASAATTLTIDASAAYPFPIVISGPGSIVKTGVGALNLSAANTYTGTTSVNGGTVSLASWNVDSSNGPWGNSTGAIQMASGGADYTGASASGLLRGVNLLSGSNTFNVVNAGTTLNFSGVSNRFQSTGGSLIKTGAGTLQLGDASIGNTVFTGKVTVNAGTLEWWAGSSMPAPASVVLDFLTLNNGGTLSLAYTGANTVSANLGMKLSGTATIATAGSPTISGVIGNGASAGGFTKTGTGTLTLTGFNRYTGLTTVNAGTLLMANPSGNLRPNNNITVNNGGTLTTVASSLGNFIYGTEATGTGVISLNSGGKASTGNGAAITLRGQSFILNGGELASGTPDASWGSWILDEGSAVTANASSVISASNLNLRAANTNFTVASGQTLNVTGTLTTSTGGGTPSGTNGGLTKLGAGTMALAGINTYAGITTVNAGKLDVVVQNGLPLNGGVVVNNSGTLITSAGHLWGTAAGTGTATINSGGTLTTANGIQSVIYRPLVLNGGTLASGVPDATFGSWRLGGPVSVTADSTISATGISTGAVVFTVNTGATLSANGVIRDDFYGVSSLNKAGAGTMTLSGANSYTGATMVSAGKTLINGNQITATGAISVASGATLGGSGTLGGAVTINSGGHLAPGNSPGTLTMAGLSLPSGSILDMELGQANVVGGALNDLVQDNGNLTLGGGTLNITVPSGGAFTGGTYRLINYTGTLTNTGGLVIGTVPAGFSAARLFIDTSVAGQVNLVVLPTLTLTKISSGGVGPFTFTGANGWSSQTITTATAGTGIAGATQILTAASTATTITETAVAGYATTAISCTGLGSGGTATPNLASGSVVLDAAATAPGSAIACTFTNTRTATVRLQAITTGGSGGPFSFAQTNLTSVPANITTTATGTATPASPTAVGATTLGTSIALTETPAIGYSLTGASCTDANSGATGNTGSTFATLSGNVLTIPAANVVVGADFTCVFTNQLLPFNYWDGAGPANNGTAEGGTGLWNATNTNWTTSTGNPNGIWQSGAVAFLNYPVGSTATLTVSGTQQIGGINFGGAGSTPYFVVGGVLQGVGAPTRITKSSGGLNTLSSVLSGGNYEFANTGTATGWVAYLDGANTFTGTATIKAGTWLRVASINALGSISAGTIVESGGAVVPQNNVITAAEPLTISGNGGGSGALNGYNNSNYTGPVTLAAASTIGTVDTLFTVSGTVNNAGFKLTALTNSGTVSFSAPISGAGGLDITGTNTILLGAANTYGGATNVAAGTLKLGVNNALPSTTAVTMGSGATLNLNSTAQSVPTVTGSGTLAFGTAGNLTLTGGASSIGAITGTGTITVNTGATLTLTAALANTGVNIVLNGGTLSLGNFTHSIGTLTVNANSTLDFSSAGIAQLTTTSLNMSASNTLAVTNWTKNVDRFYAMAVGTPTPAKDVINVAPLNRITMGANAAALTSWLTTGSEISVLTPPTVAMAFSPASVNSGVSSTLTITLTNPNAAVLTNAAFTNTYPANLANAATPSGTTTCMNGTVTAAAAGTSLALSGASIPASGSCTVTVNVTSTTVGSYIDTLAAGAVTSSGGANAAAASATLAVTFVGTYWDGANTTANGQIDGGISTWDAVTTNWTSSTGTPNGAWAGGSSVAVFQGSSAGAVAVSGTQSIGGLTFNIAGYGLSGGTLLMAGTNNPFTSNTSPAPTIASVIAGAASAAFQTAGTGQLRLLGNNTFQGAATVSSGVLFIDSASALGATSAGTTVANGASLRLSGSTVYAAEPLTISGSSALTSAGIASGANTWTGPVTLAADAEIANASAYLFTITGGVNTAGFVLTAGGGTGSNTVFNSAITGTGAYIKNGLGQVRLDVAATYGGATTVSAGTLQLGINGGLPAASPTAVGSGATLDLNGKTQTLSGGLASTSGTLALGTGGGLTLSGGSSSIGAVTGTGTITVNTGATLTLTAALSNTGVNIVLNGGTLNLGSLTHSTGTLTVNANANSTLDFSSAGNARLTTTSLTLSASNTLAVTNWTQTSDHFYATAFVGAVRDTIGASPMNRITLGSGAASLTIWKTDNEITLQLDPKLRIAKTSNGGVGAFVFQMTGLSATNDSIATIASGVAVQGIGTLTGTPGVAVTITESGVPAGWPTHPLSASCVDANGASNANGTAAFGTLVGNTLSIPAARMLQGADIVCSFVNTLNAISGIVFNDGGAPAAGANTGIPNDGLQNGSEAGLAGVGVGLTDCASVTHATATTDSTGRYALSAPAAAVGQTVCVQPTLIAGQRPTGANVEGTVTPDGVTTTVGGTAFVYSRATNRQSFVEPASGTRTMNFGVVPESTLAANSTKNAAAGATALHAHTFVAGTGGSVSFASGTATATPAMAGWNEVMYLNPGCATSLQPGATKLSPPSVAQNVVQGQTLCFFVQAFVPASAVNGSSNSVPVIATMTFTNAAPLLTATYTVTDVTTSGNSALSLQKEVRNITTGGAWGTSNQAKSGDTLEYRISYVNPSAAPLSTVVITDGTNLYTTFVSANASTPPPALGNCTLNTPNNPAPATGVACTPLHLGSGKGTVRWEFSGTLAPGASGSVTYSVLVD